MLFKTLDDMTILLQNSQIDIYEYFQTNHGLVKLKVNDIMYFEYSERKINLYTNNDSIYQFYDTIYKLEERFKQYHFISPHKAFLVNIDYIQNIHLNDLILEKDIIIPVSKLKKKQIKDAYLNAISKKWINRFMIYQKIFVDILLLFNGMILNYLYFHFYDSRYILRLSQFQKMLTVCLLALMFVFVYSDFGYCSYIFTSLLGFLFIRIFYHFEEKSEYITQVVFFFILMFSDLFASIFTNLIIRFFDMQRNSVLELSYFSILLTTLIIIILYSFLNAKLIGISYKNLAKKELIIYVGSLVFSWLLCLILISFLLYFKDLLFQFFVCFVILFILLLDLFLVYSAQTKVNNNLLEKEMRIVNQKSDLLMKYYENVKNQDQENSIFRHDLKNHLSVIKDSLPECMSVYVNDIMSHIDKDNIRFYSDNKILEALINDKLDQAKRNGIELSVKCDDTNIEILSDYDLVTILSNLIDNSIDAVNTNISEERQIILRIKEVKNNLVIKIKNAFNNEIRYNKEELMSTKEGHSGLGIKSVKSVVSKYQGEIRMDITDNMFSVLIIIPFHP